MNRPRDGIELDMQLQQLIRENAGVRAEHLRQCEELALALADLASLSQIVELPGAEVDAAALRQLWRILIDNALKFSAKRRQPRLTISVRSETGEAGSGVGLAIAKQLVTRHGGRIWAYHAPDEGACFHFALPSSA